MGCGNINSINTWICQECFVTAVRNGDVEFLGEFVGAGLAATAHGNELSQVGMLHPLSEGFGDISGGKQSPSDFFHEFTIHEKGDASIGRIAEKLVKIDDFRLKEGLIMAKIQSDLRLCLCARMRKSTQRSFHSGPHQHPFYEFGVVLSGQCRWTLGKSKRMVLNRGEILLLPPGTTHQEDVEANAEGRVMWVGFESTQRDLSSVAWKKLEMADMTQVEGLLRWIELEWNSAEKHSAVMACNALEMLLMLMERAVLGSVAKTGKKRPLLNERQSRIVKAARSYFEQNTGIPRSVEQIARYHSLSVSHFSALFRKDQGIGPREFVQRLRLKETGRLLKETDMPMKEVAVRYGYVDAAHFCRHFKKETGYTPGEFRRRNRVDVPALK